MRRCLAIYGMLLCGLSPAAFGSIEVVNTQWNVDQPIPDGNPVGMTVWQTFQNLDVRPITDVAVELDISGGYDGNLYAFLTLQDDNGHSATEILLNRVGTSPSNPVGSSGAGFSHVILNDAGTVNGSIHGAPGIPTGLWLADSADSLDSTFGGLTANGTWTLFIADMAVGGGTSRLESWGLDIGVDPPEPVPEPGRTGLIFAIAGAATGLETLLQRKGRKQTASLRPCLRQPF